MFNQGLMIILIKNVLNYVINCEFYGLLKIPKIQILSCQNLIEMDLLSEGLCLRIPLILWGPYLSKAALPKGVIKTPLQA